METEDYLHISLSHDYLKEKNNNVVLAQKQAYRSVAQNRVPRNKPTQLHQSRTKEARTYNRPKIVSSETDIRKAGQPHVNQWTYNTPSHYTQK